MDPWGASLVPPWWACTLLLESSPGGAAPSVCWLLPVPLILSEHPLGTLRSPTYLLSNNLTAVHQETGFCLQPTGPEAQESALQSCLRPAGCRIVGGGREGGVCIPALSHTPNCDLEKHVSQSLPQESGQAESRIPARRTPSLQISVVGNCSSQLRTMALEGSLRNFPGPGRAERCLHPSPATNAISL